MVLHWVGTHRSHHLTHDGSTISLLLLSPAAMKSRVRAAVAARSQRAGLRQHGRPGVHRRAKALLGKALSAFQKTSLWMCAAFESASDDINPPCLLCGESIDTPFHRVWECGNPEITEARWQRLGPLAAVLFFLPRHLGKARNEISRRGPVPGTMVSRQDASLGCSVRWIRLRRRVVQRSHPQHSCLRWVVRNAV